MRDPTKNLGLIGSAVLTFIGYKQTDKPNLYIEVGILFVSMSDCNSNLSPIVTHICLKFRLKNLVEQRKHVVALFKKY